MRVALTVAGSDSGGGAGIQADIKTFASLGVHGVCAVTAITAQDTVGVHSIYPLPPEIVRDQIETVVRDFNPSCIKTGMIPQAEVIDYICRKLGKRKLIVDPVIYAQTGEKLVGDDAIDSMRRLIKAAYITTPNREEASIFTGRNLKGIDDVMDAAREISSMGAKHVVITGGSSGVDVFYDGRSIKLISCGRIEMETRGAGCTFSAAVAAEIAKGADAYDAVLKANEFVHEAIRCGSRVGRGLIPLNQSEALRSSIDRSYVVGEVELAASLLEDRGSPSLAPEVGINVGMALLGATDIREVAAISGRIVRDGERLRAVGRVKFGASDHIARMILAAVKIDREMRAAINIRYDDQFVSRCRRMGLKVVKIDRKKLPKEDTLSHGISSIGRRLGKIPTCVYDLGDVGKEPMMRIFGRSATEVALIATKIAGRGENREH